MFVLTVARKPLSGLVSQTVLKYGTGGINIGDCRIGTTEILKGGSGGLLSHRRDGKAFPEDNGYHPASGRWPSNVIFQHLHGCKNIGAQQVKAISGGVFSGSNAFGQDTGWNSHKNRPTVINRPDTEIVCVWNCQSGCAIEELDIQSGNRPGDSEGRSPRKNNTDSCVVPFTSAHISTGFYDGGGASRFFKQIQAEK
jgi:hypothetical protein